MEGVTVTSAYLSIRDLLCEAESMTLTCYPFTGSEWTETTANWSMTQSWGAALDSKNISYANGRLQEESHRYNFDISALVQQWVDGTVNDDLGVILRADDSVEQSSENFYKTFGSYERSSNKTYFVMEYNENISLSREDVDVYVGDSLTLYASTFPSGQNVTWSSENPEIATVEHGTVTGISPGTTTITARIDEDSVATCEVTVLPKSVTLNPTSLEMYVGQENTITVATQPIGEDVDWQSENSAVATVVNGVVTGISPGTTTITARVDENTVAYCEVTVLTKSVTLVPTSINLYMGDTTTLTASTVPDGESLVWTSSNESVATVTDGEVTTLSVGETVIRAAIDNEVYAECTVNVVEFALTQSSVDVDETQEIDLSVANLLDGYTVVWSTANEAVATVDETGKVTGVKAGMTTITARVAENISDTCTVYVTIPDGIYHITDRTLRYRLQTENKCISSFSNVVQDTIVADTAANIERIGQMWRITYIGEGMYTIRPINNSDMCLYADVASATDSIPVVIDLSDTDEYEEVPVCCQWTISRETNGFVIRFRGSSVYALQTVGGNSFAGTQIIADSYSATEPSCNWILTPVEDIPTGFVLYDVDTGLPADLTVKRYIAPEEVRSLGSMGLKLVTYPDASVVQYLQISSRNSNLAQIEGKEDIVGVAPGETSVYICLNQTGDTDVYDASFPLVVTEIPEGTYFLRNKTTECYADIDYQIMEDGRTIHQWEFHGGNTQKWVFTHLGDGTYSIHSKNASTRYYLGVSGDSSTIDQPVVLRTGAITSGMKWTVEKTENGAYKLIPKSGEANGCVLATSKSSSANGAILVQGKYRDNNSYRDEWLISTSYSLSINIFYDYAFAARYSNAENLLDSFQPQVKEIFGEIFGLSIAWNTPQKIYSTPDMCKVYAGVGINANTVDAMCTANPSLDVPCCNYCNVNYYEHANNPMSQYYLYSNCTSYYQIYHDFIKTYPGNNVTTSVLFTGNALYNDEGELCNRCYKWYNSGVLMLDNSSSTEEYYDAELLTFVHELSHTIGAQDHYHSEKIDENGKKYCVNREKCYTCNSETGRPMWCLMDMGIFTNSPDNVNTDMLYCSACMEEIFEHLSHHKD